MIACFSVFLAQTDGPSVSVHYLEPLQNTKTLSCPTLQAWPELCCYCALLPQARGLTAGYWQVTTSANTQL